jgi:hypothetical protein
MDSAGDEKRIRALFCELTLEDQSAAPQFAHLWTRAQVVNDVDAHSFGRPVVALITALVVAGAFAVWSWYGVAPSSPSNIVNVQPQGTISEEAPQQTNLAPVSQPARAQPPRQKNIARRRQTDRNVIAEAALLSSWHSPTQSFMASPTRIVPGSLPQLNQSVKDLESFLPKNNEIMKESNQ